MNKKEKERDQTKISSKYKAQKRNSQVGIGTSVPIAKLQVNGNISGSSFTGSVFGTSSWSSNTTSASYALSASYAPGLTTLCVNVYCVVLLPLTTIYCPITGDPVT